VIRVGGGAGTGDTLSVKPPQDDIDMARDVEGAKAGEVVSEKRHQERRILLEFLIQPRLIELE
jgi:hypothetical protein